MGFHRSQPLVPIFQRDPGFLCQSFGKFVNIRRLPTLVSTHVNRVAHQQKRYFPLRDQVGQGGHILTDVYAFQRREALRGDTQRIAESQSNALFAQIEGKNAPSD